MAGLKGIPLMGPALFFHPLLIILGNSDSIYLSEIKNLKKRKQLI